MFTMILVASHARAANVGAVASGSEVSSAPLKQSSLWVKVGFLGDFYNDSYNSNQRSGLSVQFLGEYRFYDHLSANVDVGVLAETGNAQIVYNNDFQTKQGLGLAEAALNYHPIAPLNLRVGAFDQGKFENSMLFTRGISFPGLQQNLQFAFDSEWKLSFYSEEAIPSSTQLTPVPTQNNGTPTFFLGGAKVQWGDPDRSTWSSALHGSYFAFSNLPDSVAQDSRFRGNTVLGLGGQAAAFYYDFQGFEGSFSFKYRTEFGLSPFVKLSAIENTQAPSGHDIGRIFTGGSELNLSDKLTLIPSFDLFQIDSDVAPSFYNDSGYGHTNYQGFAIQTTIQLPSTGLYATVRYANANAIQVNPYQNNFNLISIQIGRNYEIF